MNEERLNDLRKRGEANGLRTHEVKELFEELDALRSALAGLTFEGSEISDYGTSEFRMCRYCHAFLHEGDPHREDCVWAAAKRVSF